MATSVDVEYTTSVVEDGGVTKYRLAVVCSNPSGGFQEELFLHQVQDNPPTDDLYLHVATIGDIDYYGTTVPVAPQDKYRRADMSEDYDSPEAALEAKSFIESRLQSVVNDFESGYGSFAGTSTDTVTDTV